jgi:hypothetical protein
VSVLLSVVLNFFFKAKKFITVKPVNRTFSWDLRKSSAICRDVQFREIFCREMQIWSQMTCLTGLVQFKGVLLTGLTVV